MSETAKRLVEHRRWAWQEGVLCPPHGRIRRVDGRYLYIDSDSWTVGYDAERLRPDLTDPATNGVLWAMLLESKHPDGWYPTMFGGPDGKWEVCFWEDTDPATGPMTLPDALLWLWDHLDAQEAGC